MSTQTLYRRARSRAGRAVRSRGELRRRIETLEAEVQENRQLNRRIAELTDIVAELLVPLSQREESRVDEALAGYRRSIGSDLHKP
jgi:hypothetical protein